jgi:hypothetical protein
MHGSGVGRGSQHQGDWGERRGAVPAGGLRGEKMMTESCHREGEEGKGWVGQGERLGTVGGVRVIAEGPGGTGWIWVGGSVSSRCAGGR